MTKEVELSISGLQWGEDIEEDNIETVVPAEYFKKNDSHYLLYEESMEGFTQNTKCRMKLKGKLLELTRQGLVSTHMVFEENKTHMTDYVTPYGKFLLGINTEKVLLEEREDFICMIVEYKIETGGKPVSENKIELHIRQRP